MKTKDASLKGRRRRVWAWTGSVWMLSVFSGCADVFGPGFVDLLDPTGQSASIRNSPGHVVVTFVNNVEYDDRLTQYLTSDIAVDQSNARLELLGGRDGLELSPAEIAALRARIRFRVQILFDNDRTLDFEFLDGTRNIIDPRFDPSTDSDLFANELTNVVAVCDVLGIFISTPIEVFVPVPVHEINVEIPTQGGGPVFFTGTIDPPQFIPLQLDDVDENNNILLTRNIGIRDAPAPVDRPRCGSVVSFIVQGTLSVPFALGLPGYLETDEAGQARVGGRYQIRTRID